MAYGWPFIVAAVSVNFQCFHRNFLIFRQKPRQFPMRNGALNTEAVTLIFLDTFSMVHNFGTTYNGIIKVPTDPPRWLQIKIFEINCFIL